MSLLMDALKKAEQSKRAQASETEVSETSQAFREQIDYLSKEESPNGLALTDLASTESPLNIEVLTGMAEEGREISLEPRELAFEDEIEPGSKDNEQLEAEALADMPLPMSLAEAVTKESSPEGSRLDASAQFMREVEKPGARPEAGAYWEANQAKLSHLNAQKKAKVIFAAKAQPHSGRARIIAAAAVCILLGCAGAGYVYWQVGLQHSSILVAVPAAPTQPLPQENTATTFADSAVGGPVATLNQENTLATEQATLIEGAENLANMPAAGTVFPAGPKKIIDKVANEDAIASPPNRLNPAAIMEYESQSIRIRQENHVDQVSPDLNQAYRLFNAGNFLPAQNLYRKVLKHEPNNRDALLGMAAVAVNRGQLDEAAAFFGRMLELNPLDMDAHAGLTALKQGDPAQSESRLKKLLAQDPQSGPVLFSLGNIHAKQENWSEAQQYYFRAFGSSPQNADYAFNLAVSLDRLSQYKLALEYYQRALQLSQTAVVAFNKTIALDRSKELQALSTN